MAKLSLVEREELRRHARSLRTMAGELRPITASVAGKIEAVASDIEALFMAERQAVGP